MKERIAPSTRDEVLRRDGFRCQAPILDPGAGPCRDAFGSVLVGARFWRDPGPLYLQMSHTKPRGELSMQKKATSIPAHLITLCPGHHTGTEAGSNWEAVHREVIRDHLESLTMLATLSHEHRVREDLERGGAMDASCLDCGKEVWRSGFGLLGPWRT